MALYGSYTDGQLLGLLKNSDQAAFTELYERYWDKLLTYVMRAVRVQVDAEDIVQELFVSLWKRREDLDIHGAVSTYIYNSARYMAFRYIERNITRSDYLKALSVGISGEPATPGIEAELFGRELEGQIDRAIDQLPERMREVFLLSRRHHLSYKEIAAKLSISEETVKKQVYLSLKLLRERLGPIPTGLFFCAVTYFL